MLGSSGISAGLIVAVVTWITRKNEPPLRRIGNAAFLGLTIGIVTFGASYSVGKIFQKKDIKETVTLMREMPMIGALMASSPEAEARIRLAIETDLGNGDRKLSGTVAVSRELMKTDVRPAVMAAPEAQIAEIWSISGEILTYLHGRDNANCRAFVTTALNMESGEQELLDLGTRRLQAFEKAYLEGRNAPSAESMTDEQLAWTIRLVGLDDAEARALTDPASASDETVCQMGLALNTGAANLPPDQRLMFQRTLIAMNL